MQRTLAMVFVLFAALLVISANAWSRLETVTCDREPNRVRCVVTRDAWLTSGSDTYEDVVDIRARDFDRGFWTLTLVDPQGRSEDVAEEITEREAKRVVLWFQNREAHVEASRERWKWHLTMLNIILLLGIGGVVWAMCFERRAARRSA